MRDILQAFKADRRGCIATLFALMTLVIFGVTGLAIDVTADAAVPTTFANVAGFSSFPLSVSATAQVGSTGSEGPNGPACLLALERSGYGIKINGGGDGSHVTTNCNEHVNSTSSSAIFGNSKGTLTSTKTCVVGNYDASPT